MKKLRYNHQNHHKVKVDKLVFEYENILKNNKYFT